MKAQSLIQLHEWEPAVHSSLHAVHESARIWAPAFQTLGRAYLGKGLVFQATAAFSKAFHLDPSDSEVLSDLNWSSRFGHSQFFVLFSLAVWINPDLSLPSGGVGKHLAQRELHSIRVG